jgi:hypothetical protein
VDAVCPSCGDHVEPNGAGNGASNASNGNGNGHNASDYRRLILLVQNSRNAKFTLGCLLIATGDSFADGLSMTDFARHWGVKKATVSKHCRIICTTLEIEPSRYMRSEETADKFRLSNRRPTKAGI